MNDPQEAGNNPVAPSDPEMAASAPEIFTALSTEENQLLKAHLTSGWYKQHVVYPTLSEPWKETSAVLDDLNAAWQIRWTAEHEPEAGQ